MSLPLVTGVAPRWEGALALVADSASGVHLVRRCADVAELVGVAAAGLAGVVLISSDLRGLDRAVVDRLLGEGVPVIAVHPPADDDAARRLSRWGVGVVLPADLTAEQLDQAVAQLAQPAGGAPMPEEPDPPSVEGPARQEDRRRAGLHRHDPGPAADPVGGRARARPPAEPLTEEDVDDLDLELRSLVEQGQGGTDDGSVAGGAGGGGGGGAPAGPDGAALPDAEEPAGEGGEPGEVVVVWGAYGSPGRTTLAVNLAAELATVLDPVLLVDADTYGASVAQTLAVLDEAPGLVAACRAADQGTLDEQRLDRLAPEVRPGLRVLTGLPRPDRWTEVRDSALADVLEQARAAARWVLVDVAPVLEQDEELSFDTAAPRRNGAALTALEAADRVLVVGAGDPLGLQRVVRALDQLTEHTTAPRTVVVTRVRPGPVGPEPGRRIQESLRRFAGADDVVLVPEDREALDAALLHGRALREVRPTSPARQAVQRLAARLAGDGGDDPAGRPGTGRGRARRLLPPWSRRA